MLNPIEDEDNSIVALDAIGMLTDEDVIETFVPTAQAAIQNAGKARILIRFGPDYQSYIFRDLASEALFGLHHWRDIDRVAIVSDNSSVRRIAEDILPCMPMRARLFGECDTKSAAEWLHEPAHEATAIQQQEEFRHAA